MGDRVGVELPVGDRVGEKLPVGDTEPLGVVLPLRDPLRLPVPPVGLKVGEDEVDTVFVVDTVTLLVRVTLVVTVKLLVWVTLVVAVTLMVADGESLWESTGVMKRRIRRYARNAIA